MNDHPDIDAALLELRVSDLAPPDEVLAARRTLNAAIEAETRSARRPRRRWLTAASGVAVVVVGVVAAISLTSVRAPSATALLFDLVEVATGSATLDPAAGEFVYVRTEGEVVVGSDLTIEDAPRDFVNWREPFVAERWFAADGAFRLRRVAGEPEFFTEAEEQLFLSDPIVRADQAAVTMVDLAAPPREVDVASLPTDTAALRAALIEAYGITADGTRPLEVELADRAAELAALHDASPELRGALLTLLADTDGIELIDSGLGEVAFGVEYEAEQTRERIELVFEAATARLVERRLVWVDPPDATTIPPGTVSYTRYDAPQVVDELGP